eukprot:294462_1
MSTNVINEEKAVEMLENGEKKNEPTHSTINITNDDNKPQDDQSQTLLTHIEVFKPTNAHGIDIDDIEHLTEKHIEILVGDNAKAKLQPKLTRVFASLLLAILVIGLVAWTQADFTVRKALSIALIVMFCIYFFHVFYLIGRSTNAYRIYSLNSTVDLWTPMPITHRALIYTKDSIGSISEFSAIGGGIANQMLMAIGILTTTGVVIETANAVWFEKIWLQFVDRLLCGSCEYKTVAVFDLRYIDIFFTFFGSFGLTLLGIFELDPFSAILPKLHYFGGLLGAGTVIGFDLQQYYTYREKQDNIFGLFWAALFSFTAVVGFYLWVFYFSNKAKNDSKRFKENKDNKSDEEIAQQVRLNSIYCILAESVFLMSGAFSLCCWLWFYGSLYPVPFESNSPGRLPNGGPLKPFYDYLVTKYNCKEPAIDDLCVTIDD